MACQPHPDPPKPSRRLPLLPLPLPRGTIHPVAKILLFLPPPSMLLLLALLPPVAHLSSCQAIDPGNRNKPRQIPAADFTGLPR